MFFLGWRDKTQHYPEDPAMDQAYHIYDGLVAKANKEDGPRPPPKFKVSLEKWLRFLVHDTDDEKMNVHWMPQDKICHFVSQNRVSNCLVVEMVVFFNPLVDIPRPLRVWFGGNS